MSDEGDDVKDGRGRWFAVGHSEDPDARRAGEIAATAALSGADAKLLIVFCAHTYDLQALLAAVNERSGGVPLIGCTTAGEIASGGPGHAGVVITALGGPGFSVATAAAEHAARDLRSAGATIAEQAQAVGERPHRALLMLTDGLAGDQQEVVRGAYGVVGASVPLVGGCAGDDMQMQATFQLHGDRILSDAVVGAAIGSDGPLGIGIGHGWHRVGEPMIVTRSSKNRVHTLNDRPAVEVYVESLDPPAAALTDAAEFTRFALSHPLGLARQRGEDNVRFISNADFEDGSLGLIADCAQGRVAWFMESNNASVIEATTAACEQAMARLEGRRPLGVLAFDCIARRGVLGERGTKQEIDRVVSGTSGAPLAGFYTYGEIARTRGQSGFHNQALVLLAVG